MLAATDAMVRHADDIARDISAMMGKPLRRHAARSMAWRFVHATWRASPKSRWPTSSPATRPAFERRITKAPLGVVLDLPAWNYPLLTAVNVVMPAVLAGNAVVVKHSPRSPLCGEHFARAFEEAAPPRTSCKRSTATTRRPNASSAITGSITSSTPARCSAGTALSPQLPGASCTWASSSAATIPRMSQPDCDFEKTVDNIVDGAIYNAGQSCCAVERVYVHRSIYPRFVEACEALVRAYVMGDPNDAATTLGPIAQPNHPAELEALVADARSKARGSWPAESARRWTVVGDSSAQRCLPTSARSAPSCKRESFGPILPIAPVDSDEEALARMNASSLGLTASVWTRDSDRVERMARSLEYGTVFMNRCDHVDPSLPWSGWKESGRGASLSRIGFDQLTRPKALHFRLVL